ncbi:MAG: HDOD domain-containing protein [Planctomycetota bacterium]
MSTTSAEVEELIDSTVSIPTIPTVLNEITAILAAPDGSAKDAAAVIERDPAIATRALRLVNSSFYGLRNPVSNINLGCSILGLQVLNNLVVQATVLQTFQAGECDALDADWLWDHSFKAAVACRMLAERTDVAGDLTPQDAYTCGLVHDVGKLILLDSQPARYGEAMRRSESRQVPLALAEREVFGFDHAHVGGTLARRWKLAPSVQDAVMFHHSAVTTADGWARGLLVKAANSYAHLASSRDAGWRGDVLDHEALMALGLSEAQHVDVLQATAAARGG